MRAGVHSPVDNSIRPGPACGQPRVPVDNLVDNLPAVDNLGISLWKTLWKSCGRPDLLVGDNFRADRPP